MTCSSDQTISLLAADDLQLFRRLHGHAGQVGDIALSPDGGFVASASEDITVRVWDLAMGAAVAVLEGHTDMVFAVRFSSEGDFLASASLSDEGSGSRSVLLWRCRDRINVAALPRQEVRAIG